MAQLVARLVRIEEVRSSNLLRSTVENPRSAEVFSCLCPPLGSVMRAGLTDGCVGPTKAEDPGSAWSVAGVFWCSGYYLVTVTDNGALTVTPPALMNSTVLPTLHARESSRALSGS